MERGNGAIVSCPHLVARHVDPRALVAATYFCDFGNVICGLKRKKVFKIFNATNLESFTWTFDKKTMQGSGFSIEPEKVEKLPPQVGVDIGVVLMTKDGGKLGRKNVVIPIELKSGGLGAPTVNLMLSANICLPDVSLSDEVLDFDRVMVGRSRKMYLR